MRLRLTIRRNGLPDSHILWNSTGLHGASPHNSTRTIADFLHEVDDVIPLESEGWGMEDYVVEVGGFECVHFSIIDNILKEDDEVVIRPMTTNDSRFRRVSGRVQISADGRRLFDGVAFGRPYVRRAPRPPVRIPWAKKARITYDEENQAEPGPSSQLVLRDEDSDDGNEEEDSDYSEGLDAEEIADLAAESAAFEQQNAILVSPNSRKRKRTGLGIQAIAHEAPRIMSFGSNSIRRSGSKSARDATWESLKNVRFEEEELDTPATVVDIASSEESEEDDSGSSQGENAAANPESNKENIAPSKLGIVRAARESSEATRELLVESGDTTSSSGSDSSSESDSSSDESTSTSDSSDESSSSDESVSQEISESITPNTGTDRRASAIATEDETTLGQDLAEPSKDTTQKDTPPGQGLRGTKKRNARRALRRRLVRAKSLGLTSPLIAGSELPVLDESQADFSHTTPEQNNQSDLEKLKTALLRNLDISLVDVSGDQVNEATTTNVGNIDNPAATQQHSALEPLSPPQELSSRVHAGTAQNNHETGALGQEQSSGLEKDFVTQLPDTTPKQQDTPRRAKLDVGSAKRMLFGSLGLRAPKSKGDADKLREQLKEKARQLPGYLLGRAEAKEKSPVPIAETEVQDDESWEIKIDLQAVECCYDGITYSKPPFPFVQRWDPQQQYQIGGQRRNGRDKRKDRNNTMYYQDNYKVKGHLAYDGYQDTHYDIQEPNEETAALDYGGNGEPDNSDAYAASDQLLGEMQAEASTAERTDDLPELPVDMSVLEILTKDTALPGCVIAFKQMEMSEQTQWSPVISDYRTAKIETILENGVLQVLLALRDVQRKEKNYDSKTGQRIYAKFEMPVDEEEENDERYLEIGLQDMIEPKLVQAVENQRLSPSFSSTVKAAVDAVQDNPNFGKQTTTAVLGSTGQIEAPAELDGVIVEQEASNVKLEKSENIDQVHQISVTTSRTESTLVASQDSQSAILTEKITSRWRDPSIELGSSNPPQRFFSEMPIVPVSDRINEIIAPAIEENNDSNTTVGNEVDNTSVSGLRQDDPSIWANETENNDESTRFYSLSDGHNNDLPSSNLSDSLDDEAITKQATSSADSSGDHEGSAVVRRRNSKSGSPIATPALEEFETSLFVDDDPSELQPADQSGTSTENDSEDDTLLQGSPSKGKSDSKNDSTTRPENSDADSDSSSLPSLQDLLSQPVVSPPKLPRRKNRKGKTSAYPKLPSASPDDVNAFVFSQAPKRFVSNEDKMAVDLENESFLGSSDLEDPNGPYELEAHVKDETMPKVEPQPPSILISHEMDSTSHVTTTQSKGSASNDSTEMVIDLTLSSDPIDSDDNSALTTSAAGSMPSGPGWLDKPARKSKPKAKTNRKSPRSSIRRKRSVVWP